MKNEEAKRLLKSERAITCVKECGSHRGYYAECDSCKRVHAMDKAIEAIEKQIPKLPIMGIDEIYPNLIVHQGFCPMCKKAVARHKDYCGFCGQRIDWSEND